jgi:type II secretory pathway pseudopilin PulG
MQILPVGSVVIPNLKGSLLYSRGAILPFFYVLLFLFGLAAIHINDVTSTNIRRQKEKELLFVGGQFQAAIESYYLVEETYPSKLEQLIDDSRFVNRRHLRKLYLDPITLSDVWGVLSDDAGKIIGVYSLSSRKPIKQTGFSGGFSEFENADSYQNWVFKYVPEG